MILIVHFPQTILLVVRDNTWMMKIIVYLRRHWRTSLLDKKKKQNRRGFWLCDVHRDRKATLKVYKSQEILGTQVTALKPVDYSTWKEVFNSSHISRTVTDECGLINPTHASSRDSSRTRFALAYNFSFHPNVLHRTWKDFSALHWMSAVSNESFVLHAQ